MIYGGSEGNGWTEVVSDSCSRNEISEAEEDERFYSNSATSSFFFFWKV